LDWLQLLFLSLIQGLTEFLPISSSAHLILPSQVLGWVDQGLAFDVAVHVGSLGAVIWYFRRDLWSLLTNWLASVARRPHQRDESKLAWLVILATIPAGLAGLLVNGVIEEHLRSTLVIALATIGFGVLLGFADRFCHGRATEFQLNWKTALVIGFAQALALIPGTSRSGITMTAALWMGLTRQAAARFSFLLSIPLILAAGLLKFKELMEQGMDAPWADVIAGTLLSAVAAYVCISLFLKMIDRIGFMPFVIYRMILGVVLLLMLVR
jgi:undecaprenyl-diphosphatase